MNKEDLKQGEWYWFNSTYNWIIKFDKIESKNLYFTKCGTPNDGYVGKSQKPDPFLIKDFTQFSPIENMEIVYKLFPEERPKITSLKSGKWYKATCKGDKTKAPWLFKYKSVNLSQEGLYISYMSTKIGITIFNSEGSNFYENIVPADMEQVYSIFPKEKPQSAPNKSLKGRWVKCISDSGPGGQWNNEKIGDYFQITDDKGVTEKTLSNKTVCIYVNDSPMDSARIWKHKQFELMPEGWQKSIPTPAKEKINPISGEIYVIHMHKNPEWDSIFLSGGGMSNTDKLYLNQPKYNKNSGEWVPSGDYEIREATKEEKIWLKACSEANKFISKEKALSSSGFKGVIGKWYKLSTAEYNGSKDVKYVNYIKYLAPYEGGYECSEYINILPTNRGYNARNAKLNDCVKIEEIDISEIQSYLPEGHIDKIKPKIMAKHKIGDWVKCISSDYIVHKRGGENEIFQITGFHNGDETKLQSKLTKSTGWVNDKDVIPLEESLNTYGLKVGDELREDILNAYGKQANYIIDDGNWQTLSSYSSGKNRIIESFEIKNGVTVFKISDTYTCYGKAEGFKEFMENFDKPKTQELYSLPEKWCIKAIKTEPEYTTLANWRTSGDFVSDGYLMCEKYTPGTKGYWVSSKLEDYTEITFEQFQKWVLKEENMENRPEYVKCVAFNDSPSNWTIDKVYKTQPNGIISDEGCDYNKPSYAKFIEWISGWGVMFKPATEAEYLAQQYPKSLFTIPKFKIGDEVRICTKDGDVNKWGYLKNNNTTEQIAAVAGRKGKISESKIHNGRNYYRIDLFFISEDCLIPVNVAPEKPFDTYVVKIPVLDMSEEFVGYVANYDPYLIEEMKTFSENYKTKQSSKNKIDECVNKVKSVEIKLVQPKKVVYF
jgi:hypothetical protein